VRSAASERRLGDQLGCTDLIRHRAGFRGGVSSGGDIGAPELDVGQKGEERNGADSVRADLT